MGDQDISGFQARLDKINHSYSKGKIRRKRRRMHVPWLGIALIFAVFIGFKTTLILVESESILESRVQNLAKDAVIMQYAGKLFQPDPVTNWIATILKDLV